MKCLDLSKATFYPQKIVIKKKKENVIIPIEDILFIKYYKPNFFNYLSILLSSAPTNRNRFEIYSNNEVYGKNIYVLMMKYKDVLIIKEFLEKEITIFDAF